MRATALALGLFFVPLVSDAIDAITNASLVPAGIGTLSFVSPAQGQPAELTKSQSDALNKYNNTVSEFRSILGQRRAQIIAHQQLPNLPGQALYLARNAMMSAYKDLTDALASKIGRPNKFGIPPAYFDVGNEPLIDEYTANHHFCDLQVTGPFRYWRHCHLVNPEMHADVAGTRITDVVDYQWPGGCAASAIDLLGGRLQIRQLFHYRQRRLLRLLRKEIVPHS